jgi:hypothetical protein
VAAINQGWLVAVLVSCGHRQVRQLATPNPERIIMPKTTTVANGSNDVERSAAVDANAVQDACNLVAIVGCWHGHLVALHRSGIGGDALINHPTSLAFVSKLNSLCRMTLDREMAALDAIDKLQDGETVEYEVIPL